MSRTDGYVEYTYHDEIKDEDVPLETHNIDVDGVLESENVYLDPKFVDHNSLFLEELDHIIYDPHLETISQESSFVSVNNDQFAHSSSMVTGVSTYLDHPFQSEDVRNLIALRSENTDDNKHYSGPVKYNRKSVYPDWILSKPAWKGAKGAKSTHNEIADILHLPPHERTHHQHQILVYWIMSVWPTANVMGYKKCDKMIQEFKYHSFHSETFVFKEGDRGLTFYIIIDGEAAVIKDGIGVVATLGRGKSFGEIALTEGKDLRTASIQAKGKLDVLCLHKLDYDTFVRDIQLNEKRENFITLKECKLFCDWSRFLITKTSQIIVRKTYEAGDYVFRQGDKPDYLYVLFEGCVHVEKAVHITCINRWPEAIDQWGELKRKNTKKFTVQMYDKRGDFFGEIAILENSIRQANAFCSTKTVLLAIDRLEYLDSLKRFNGGERKEVDSASIIRNISAGNAMLNEKSILNKPIPVEIQKKTTKFISKEDRSDEDMRLLKSLRNVTGGPTSTAKIGKHTYLPNEQKREHNMRKGYIDGFTQVLKEQKPIHAVNAATILNSSKKKRFNANVLMVRPPHLDDYARMNKNKQTESNVITLSSGITFNKDVLNNNNKIAYIDEADILFAKDLPKMRPFTSSVGNKTDVLKFTSARPTTSNSTAFPLIHQNSTNAIVFAPVQRDLKANNHFSFPVTNYDYEGNEVVSRPTTTPLHAVVTEMVTLDNNGRRVTSAKLTNLGVVKESLESRSNRNTLVRSHTANNIMNDSANNNYSNGRPATTNGVKQRVQPSHLLGKAKLTYKDVMNGL